MSWESAMGALNAACLAAFGREVTYSPAAGAPVTVTGMLETGVRLEETAPGIYAVLFLRRADLPQPPQRGDEVEIDGAGLQGVRGGGRRRGRREARAAGAVGSHGHRPHLAEEADSAVDRLNFPQQQMFKIGNVGVAAVKNRVGAALGPERLAGQAAHQAVRHPEDQAWQRQPPQSDVLTGDMLRNLQVRTVSENKARAGLSTRKDRIKAWANQKIEPWLVFSPKNQAAVVEAARRVMQEAAKRLVLERSLGGRQQ